MSTLPTEPSLQRSYVSILRILCSLLADEMGPPTVSLSQGKTGPEGCRTRTVAAASSGHPVYQTVVSPTAGTEDKDPAGCQHTWRWRQC